MDHTITLTVNGITRTATVPAHRLLLELIRDGFGLTGTKLGCGNGECGACTVILNGEPVRACLILAVEADGATITTIEGVGRGTELSPVQQGLVEAGAVQCGFCIPGFVMAGEALLARHRAPPGEPEIREALGGHLCRCTGYEAIVAGFRQAAKKSKRTRRTTDQRG